jgi:hypothetical protein
MDEEFDAEETDIALLTHAIKPMAKVMEAEPKPGKGKPDKSDDLGRTAKPEPETQAERRIYKRRDMKAED